jgi:pimeloyl-ACP methyl ester carboxylesterase
VTLGRRGTTFVREAEGPRDAPTLVLLHGWCASGGLNWFRAFEPLSAHFRVLAPDLRGHARGIRSRKVFRLHDCADDVAATLVALGTGPVIAVGYSMGGPVAQLLWRRHRDLVDGLVLCATGPGFVPGGRERLVFTSMMALAAGTTRLGGIAARIPGIGPRLVPVPRGSRPSSLELWAAAEMRRHDWRMILEAGHSLGTFHSKRWIHEIDVPTAVLVTTRDRAVAPHVQRNMAETIPDATLHTIDDGHVVCAKPAFAAPLVDACLDVASRVATR